MVRDIYICDGCPYKPDEGDCEHLDKCLGALKRVAAALGIPTVNNKRGEEDDKGRSDKSP